MKKLIIVIICTFSTFNYCMSQEPANNLNTNINNIVFIQILNNLEVNYPLVIATPYFFAMTNVQHSNIDMLIGEETTDPGKLIVKSALNRQELFRSLNIEFIPLLKVDTTIQIQAKMKNKVLFTIKFAKTGTNETYSIANPDNSITKEINYQNGQFIAMNVIKPDERFMVVKEKKADNLFCQTIFNSKTGKYSISEYFYQNDFLKRKIVYKSSTDRKSRDIELTINYIYDPSGRIISISGIDYKGKNTDSISYFYNDLKLHSIVTFSKDAQSTIFYEPETELISAYIYKELDHTITLRYEYNTNNQVENISLNDSEKQITESYNFEYNSSYKLVSIKKYETNRISKDINFQNQFIFSYNSDLILTSMLVTDNKGNIKKEINYEINYLN